MLRKRYRDKRRAVVQTTGRPSSGSKLWAYGYRDLAVLLATTESAVRQRVKRRDFNPADLTSICEHWLVHRESILLKRAAQENSPKGSGLTPEPGVG